MRHFNGGPWADTITPVWGAVPSMRVKVFATPSDFEGQCPDEQVTRCLGHYARRDEGTHIIGMTWEYDWVPEP